MFLQDQGDYIEARFFSTRYLGRLSNSRAILAVLERQANVVRPDHWGTDERTRFTFDQRSWRKIEEEWTQETAMKEICFGRKRPELLLCFSIERFPRAKFNDVALYVRAKILKTQEHVDELLDFSKDLCSTIQADYGFIAHTIQERRQSPVLTPAERLPGVYWANFFGRPYLEFFGRQKLLSTSCYRVRDINETLVLLQTAERPDSAEMLKNDLIVNSVKKYLNQNAFAGPKFPDEACSLPIFDFNDVRSHSAIFSETDDLSISRLRHDLESRGYTLVSEVDGQLNFRDSDGSWLSIDVDKKEIVADLTNHNDQTSSL
jgi:hypothetical protein